MKKILQILLIYLSTLSSYAFYIDWKNFEIISTTSQKLEYAKNENLFLMTRGGYLLNSTDKGKNWYEIDLSSTNYEDYYSFNRLYDFEILPSGTIILSKGIGPFRSSDNGLTWNYISHPDIDFWSELKFQFIDKEGNIYADDSWDGYCFNFAKLSKDGTKWEKIYLPFQLELYSFTINSQGHYFALANSMDYRLTIFRSMDEGKTWDTIKHYQEWLPVGMLFSNQSDTVFGLSGSSNILYFIKKGSDSLESKIIDSLSAINKIQQDYNKNIYFTTDSGFYKYLNKENKLVTLFNRNNFFLNYTPMISVNNKNEFLIYGDRMYRSKNYGNTWDILYKASFSGRTSILDSLSELINLVNDELFGITSKNKLVKADKDGRYWKELIINNFSNKRFSKPRTNSWGKMYLFADSIGLFTSVDYGENFYLIDSITFKTKQILSFYIDSTNKLFVGTDSGLFISTNDGFSWNKLIYFPDKPVYTITQSSLDTFYAGVGNEFWISYDWGFNWELVRNYFHRSKNITCIEVNSKKEIFVGTNGGGIFRYHINEWDVINKGLIGYQVNNIAITTRDELLISTNKGISFTNLNGNYWQLLSIMSNTSVKDILITRLGKIICFNGKQLKYADSIIDEPMYLPHWGTEHKHQILYPSSKNIICFKYSKDGKFIFTVDYFSHFRKWDSNTGELINDLELPFDSIMAVNISDNETQLAIIPYNKINSIDTNIFIYIYDLVEDKTISNFDINDGLIISTEVNIDSLTKISITFIPETNYIITSVGLGQELEHLKFTGSVNIWDWKLKTHICKFFNSWEPQIIKLVGNDKIGIETRQRYYYYEEEYERFTDSFKLIICDYSLKTNYELDSYYADNKFINMTQIPDMIYNESSGELFVTQDYWAIKFDIKNPTKIDYLHLGNWPTGLCFSKDFRYLFYIADGMFRSYFIELDDVVENYYGIYYPNGYMLTSPDSHHVALFNDNELYQYEPIVISKNLKAIFSSDSTSILINNKVKFFDLSDNPLWRIWDFGDGAISDEQNPEHYYRKSGFFDVKLIVSDGNIIDTFIRESYIYVRLPLYAKFNATPKSGYLPLKVNFTDLSRGDVQERIWNFGDGSDEEDDEINPIKTYYRKGKFVVSLRIRDYLVYDYYYDTIYVYDRLDFIKDDKDNEFNISITPNPAFDFVIISFSVVEPSFVNISLSDRLGNKVYSLQQEYLDTGYHSKKLDVNRFDNGIYFLRISSNGIDKTFKIAVLR